VASHASAVKKQRRDEKRRLHNRTLRSRYRTQMKKIRALLDSGDLDGARKILPATLSLVDRSAKLLARLAACNCASASAEHCIFRAQPRRPRYHRALS